MPETHSKKEETPNKKSDKAEKPPVDNAALAQMLRESANIVEKGEFDVLLYHALQDFRTYYKQKLPKKKDKSKKKHKVVSTTTTHVPPETPTKATSEPATASTTPAPAPDPPAVSETPDATPSQEPRPDALDNAVSPESARVDTYETLDSAAARLDTDATHATLDSAVGAEEFSNESSGPSDRPIAHQESAPTNQVESSTPNSSKITAGMFRGKMKLPKSLPKSLPKNLPKMNLHVRRPDSGKKKEAERSKAEVEKMTGGSLAQQAESSRRRNIATDGEIQTTYLQPAVSGMDATPATPPKETPVDRAQDSSLPTRGTGTTSSVEPAVGEIPASSRSLGSNAQTTTTTATNESPFPSELSDTFASAHAPSTPGSTHIDLDLLQDTEESMQHGQIKPAFQRPNIPNSSLVANGWIEQQRRSKMRFVWKDVLASLVEGKRPGEETTLWIQREITNPVSGKKELEALHQIPVKLLESVTLKEYSTDNQFSLKLFNSPDEFVFRCNSDASAAMNWTLTLLQYENKSKSTPAPPPKHAEDLGFGSEGVKEKTFEDEKKGPDPSSAQQHTESTRLAIRDLRAICHGAGINTAGMERAELERAAAEVEKRGTYFPPPNQQQTAPPVQADTNAARTASQIPPPQPAPASAPTTNSNAGQKQKMSVKDLRAICHGSGISTVGMERGELEKAAAEVQKRGTYFAPPKAGTVEPPKQDDSWVNDMRKQEEIATHKEEMRRQEALRQKQEYEAAERQRREEEERRRREEEERRRQAEGDQRKRAEEEARRRQAEEEHRRRIAEEEARRRQAEEEHRRRMAAEEEHRRRMAEQQAAEQRRRYAEQQAAWQQQKQQEEHRRRAAEQQAAEQRRRHEEAVRQQQQWAGQQPQAQQQTWTRNAPQQSRQQPPPQQQQWAPQPQQHPRPGQQQQQWQKQQQQQQWHHHQQQQYQQQQGRPQAPPQQRHAPPPQQPNASAASSKYAKMANQTDGEDGQAAITKLKHDVLIQWALQPPQLQMLRSIDILISTIQNVFPPALGVPAHDYFKKWKAFSRNDVLGDNSIPDEEKLKKAVRKLRFFLHPDKLPKDLNTEQQFMVKMLWDVTNDAWEEFQKSKEHLDWIK